MKRLVTQTFIGICVLIPALQVYPFEPETHRDFRGPVVKASTLDSFLKSELGFIDGVNEELQNRTIVELIGDGSFKEDAGIRFFNHFHNPLRAWNRAGLTGFSALLWSQNPVHGFSWENARTAYFDGLTSTSKDKREEHLANVFRTLGHLIHPVQDMAQPAHTRDDPHPINTGLEGYVEDVRQSDQALFSSWINRPPIPFAQSLLATASPNPSAPVPIAHIIDTTDSDVSSATPSAGTDQGLAEYSNANFLSEDTIFKDFIFPSEASLGAPFDGQEPGTNRPRRYFPKVSEGDTGYRLVAEGVWWEKLLSFARGDRGYILDRGIFSDYAAKLLPRAVGYSAGLLDYFFRGRIEFET